MKTSKFHKILVANRGEIALRVIRAIRELDKLAVVIHSDDDKGLPFVTEADEAYTLGSGDLSDTYLNISKILQIARAAHVDAIHPGYGFLAENPDFAAACEQQKIHFIGPGQDVIRLMGHKSNAREKARELGLPILDGIVESVDSLISSRDHLPYPVLIKPSGGGGGKGMRIVHAPEEFESAALDASREARNYFGSEDLYVEKFLQDSRHIEVQVIADYHGNMVHLFERECSLQRRYQKIIEEAPSPSISEETRDRLTSSALQLVKGIGYTNAGTVEFLMDNDNEFYFLEMNTRIQVEHPVSEMITGIDLVREQIRIAEGFPLSFKQNSLSIKGHSIEARIYAEEPEKEFRPSSGRIETFSLPVSGQARVDSGFRKGNLVEPYYDPMLAKVIVAGTDREDARNLLIRALKEVRITGLKTNRDFLIELLRSAHFTENRIHTSFIDRELDRLLERNRENRKAWDIDLLLSVATLVALQPANESVRNFLSPWHSIGHWRILPEITLAIDHKQYRISYELQKGRERMRLHIGNKDYDVTLERRVGEQYWIRINDQILKVWGKTDRSEILLDVDGHIFRLRRLDILDNRYINSGEKDKKEGPGEVTAPLNGRVVQINVKQEDEVREGETLMVIESMKMENKILASHDATVRSICVSSGDRVQTNQLLITLASI